MNVYYYPENFGLQIIDSIDKADSYEFDMFVVWKKENGDVVFATDSGCSCPTPFDGVGLTDLKPYSDQELDTWVNECKWRTPSPIEVLELKKKVKEALR